MICKKLDVVELTTLQVDQSVTWWAASWFCRRIVSFNPLAEKRTRNHS